MVAVSTVIVLRLVIAAAFEVAVFFATKGEREAGSRAVRAG